MRLAVEIKQRLELRRALDHQATGIAFAETHYVNAALESIPEDLDLALEWVEQYRDRLGYGRTVTVGTTGRVLLTTAQRMGWLSTHIRLHAGYGLVGHLQSAALQRLLDELDLEDLRPEQERTNLDEPAP